MALPLRLNPALDIPSLGVALAGARRTQIMAFLDGSVVDLAQELATSDQWRHVIRGGDNVFEIAADALDAMPVETRAPIDEAVIRSAAEGFQFRYDVIRVPDRAADRATVPPRLNELASLLNAPATLDVLRHLTADPDIAFVDMQATRYRTGDFLTRHDDHVRDKDRRFAYVLGLSPDWRPEWGGLLVFHGPDETVAHVIVPRFNALSLFAVPQSHSVTYVAPYARAHRVSVTGWLRADKPDQPMAGSASSIHAQA